MITKDKSILQSKLLSKTEIQDAVRKLNSIIQEDELINSEIDEDKLLKEVKNAKFDIKMKQRS